MSIFDQILSSPPMKVEVAPEPPPKKLDVASWSDSSKDRFKAPESHAPVRMSDDLKRVLGLVRRPPIDLESAKGEALVELMVERLGRGDRNCKCTHRHLKRLLPVQAWVLYEAPLAGGLIGSIGTGYGKTICDILTPMVMPDCKQAVLLIPPGLKQQLWDEWLDLNEHFRVPSIMFDDNTRGKHIAGRPCLHVITYSKLSRPESTDMLLQLNPDLIIADELQKLAHPNTSTVRRFRRHLMHRPDTRFCGWSGTITQKSIEDYAFLMGAALGEGSVLPLHSAVVKEWASAIDPSEWPADPGALKALCQGGESLYEGYQRRFRETRGIVATVSSSIGASIYIHERKIKHLPDKVKAALDTVRGWERPDGAEFLDITEKVRCAKEVACGFYYRWLFEKGTSKELKDEWFKRRKAWGKELRAKLENPRDHLDSPKLCEDAVKRFIAGYKGELPVWNSYTWEPWNEIKHKIRYKLVPEWVDTFLVEDTLAWAEKHKGIIWYEFAALGQKIAQMGDLTLHGGGPDAPAALKAEKGDNSIVVSLKAHGTGRDGLQHLFYEQLFANCPASAVLIEQALGRLHRIGQKAEEVNSWVYRHTHELKQMIDRAVVQAKYVEGTLGQKQRLLSATCDFALEADDSDMGSEEDDSVE